MTCKWLTFRSTLADWLTTKKNFAGAQVSYENIRSRIGTSPLFIAYPFMVVGLLPGGGLLYNHSKVKPQEVREVPIIDALATETGELILTEAGELINVR